MITQGVAHHVSEDCWERHKATIRKLYLEENKTLDEVMAVMSKAYGFVSAYKPSFAAKNIHSYLSRKSNYERRIRRWKLRKNHAASEWKAVVQTVQSRDWDGKKSNVYIDGRVVSSEKLQRKKTHVTLRASLSKLHRLEELFQSGQTTSHLSNMTLYCAQQLVEDPYRLHRSNDSEFQHSEHQIFMEQDSHQPRSFATCIPPSIVDSLNRQQLAACHFRRVIPILKSLLPSSETRGYSVDSSISVDSLCSTYIRLLIFSTANNFAGLDDFPLEDLVHYLQGKVHALLSQIRSIPGFTVKALIEKFFQAAVNAGNEHVVETLLRDWATNVEANKQVFLDGEKRYTALQRPCQLHHIAVARVLLRHGADANQMIKRHEGLDWTALELAVGCHKEDRNDHPPVPPELVLLLIESGANFGYKLLSRVVMRGHVQVLEILLHKLVQVNSFDLVRFGFFHRAIDIVDSEMVLRIINIMLQSKVDLNHGFPMVYGCNEKRYLIEIAAQKANANAVQTLLDAGAIMTKDVLSYAVQSGEMALINSLLAQGANVDTVVTLKVDGQYTVYTTPFAESIRVGVPELTRLLQNMGALQRITEETRFKAALQAASEVGNVSLIRFLTDVNPDLGRFTNERYLWHAITGDHEEASVVLIDHGADIQRDGSWPTRCPLTEAVKRGRSLLVRKILGAEPEKRPSIFGPLQSPLQVAIKSGNVSIIRDLIAAGTDVNASNLPTEIICQSPLSAAVEKNDAELVALLVKNGAQVNSTEFWGYDVKTALEAAVRTRSTSMIRKLFYYGADPCDSGALLAAIEGNKSLALLLLKEFGKRYPLGRPGYGVRALGKAIEENDLDLIKLLIEHKVDVSGYIKYSELNHAPEIWKTPLAVAIENNKGTGLQAIGLLLDARVNPDSLVLWHNDSRRETPLLVAIRLRNVEMVKVFLNSGASINFPPKMGVKRTPLQQAAEVGDMAITQTLLCHGARVNDAPAYIGGATALQLAAIGGYVGIAELLLQFGADINALGATVDGQTALEGAAENGRLDMVKFLINGGALNAADSRRHFEKSMRLAWSHGHNAVVDLLWSSSIPDQDYYSHELNLGPATRAVSPCDFNVSVASDDPFHRIRKDGEDGDLALDIVLGRLWGQ